VTTSDLSGARGSTLD